MSDDNHDHNVKTTVPLYNFHTGNEDGQWDNTTKGLGVSFDPTPDWTVGAQVFENSYDKDSAMLYAQRNKAINDYLRVNIGGGVANNYEDEYYNYNGYTGFPFIGASIGPRRGVNLDVRTTAPFNKIWDGESVTNFGVNIPVDLNKWWSK